MTTNGAVTDFLGQQTQFAQPGNLGQIDQQGFFDVIVRSLPQIIQIVQNVAGQSVGGQPLGSQSLGGQSLGGQSFIGQSSGSPTGGQVDQQGFFDAIIRSLPQIIQVVQNVVGGQSIGRPLGGQSFGGQSAGLPIQGQVQGLGQGGQQVDPQFLQFILPFLPTIASVVGGLLRGQSIGGQSLGQQSLGGQSALGGLGQGAGNVDQQGFFDAIIRSLPQIIQVVQNVIGQSVGGQSLGQQSLGGQQAQGQLGGQQLDPQFLQFIVPFIPAIVSLVSNVIGGVTRQSVGGQSLGGQSLGGQNLFAPQIPRPGSSLPYGTPSPTWPVPTPAL